VTPANATADGRPVPWVGAPRPPRRWQAAALPLIGAELRRGNRTIVSAVTGSGKSVLLSEMAYLTALRCALEEVVVIATPTRNLVRQLAQTVAARCGLENVGVYYGDKKQPNRRVIVTCNPSLAKLQVMLAALGKKCRLLIVDECHGSEADRVREVIPKLAPVSCVGFTATPYRSSKTETLSIWQSVAYRYRLSDALADGVLVPFDPVNWDGSGNFDVDGRVSLDLVCHDLIRRHARGPGIVSALNIPDAEDYAAFLTERGLRAEAIHSKLGETEQTERIAALKRGDLACLVHVSMLAEGVDLPWLRWLCLRRPVQARVRLVQEIGRVLRVDPEAPVDDPKLRATVIDPHDLLGELGIAHGEDLGRVLEEEALGPTQERRDSDGEPDRKPLPEPRAIDAATNWSRRLLLALQAEGLASSDTIPTKVWRTADPTDKQIRALQKMASKVCYLPREHRPAVQKLIALAPRLQRGAVSDLVSVLLAVTKAAGADPYGRWDWPAGLDVPPLDPAALNSLPGDVVPFSGFRRTA
jgi:superfamily II DNA or RNA helicase